ncbi:MAG TPA: hypothetical protein VIB48_13975 [Acidimicrobiia bacterium]
MPQRRPDPVEARVDRLFEEPPERFTAARDALAKELRADGEAQAAEEVRRLRRPTVAAWALNQLARRHPDEVRVLTDLGDELRRAQRRALSGVTSDELRRLGAERRKVVEQLSTRADEVLAEAGRARSPGLQQAVVNTLEAAAISADDGAALEVGRLARDLTPESGFGTIDGFSVVPPPAPARRGSASRPPTPPDKARARPRDDRKERKHREELDAARARVAEAEREAQRRGDEEHRAVVAHDTSGVAEEESAGRVRELERELRDARTRLDRDRASTRDTRRTLDQARRVAARAAHDVDVARAALERLEAGDDDGR